MGAALKLKRVIANLKNVLAIEFLCAAQGIDFLAPLKPGWGAQKAYQWVRSVSRAVTRDRSLASEIGRVGELIDEKKFSQILKSV
jgi:histidine ammonia-lyase